MDPKKRARTVGRVEIVREAVSRRKIRLSDIMSEGFSKYLMELDGDFIAPTGLRVSELDEAPTQDQIKNRAYQIYKNNGGGQQNPKVNWDQATEELEDEEELVDARSASSPTSPENEEGMAAFQAGRAAAAPPPATPPAPPSPEDEVDTDVIDTDTDDAGGASPGGDDASGFDDPVGGEGGGDTVDLNDDNPEVEDPEDGVPQDVQQIDDIQGTGIPADDPSKDLGGPDEFDEKNKAFTSYIDRLITGVPAAAGGEDSLPAVSESLLLRPRSLIEAVYGSRKLEIVNYKRSR